MATGIPKSKRSNTNRGPSFRLEYLGKQPIESILNSKCAQLEEAAHVAGNPVNVLAYGDNAPILRAFRDEYAGKIRLIYIDPPYATGSRFECRQQNHAYDDLLNGAHYLEFLRERLILLRELLADDGSIYVHLDENMAFPVKILMDEIFGHTNFRNWITRKKCNTKNYTKNTFGKIADYILFYSKSAKYVWNQPFAAWTETTAAKEYGYSDKATGRRYKKVPVHAPGVRRGATGGEWKGRLPPAGKHWQYTPGQLDEMDARGEIYWSPTGNPRRKIFLDQSAGIPIQDIWMEFKDAHNQNIRITGYPTEKNPGLIARIVQASSNPGDIVLDAFSGSGTTACVAEELNRRWIAIDSSPLAIATTMKRLAQGSARMGDYVNRPDADDQNLALFEAGRVLTTGLRLLVQRDERVEPLPAELLSDWMELFR